MAHKPDNERQRAGNACKKQNLSAEGCRVSHEARVYLLVGSGHDSSLCISIPLVHGKQSERRTASFFFFLRWKPFKPVWSCLRFKWQLSESQIVFFALSSTMIIVIEQNVVFSTEVDDCRHLRLYLHSSLGRFSSVPPLHPDGARQGAKRRFCSQPQSAPHGMHASVLHSAPPTTPFLCDFFSVNFIPEWSVIWALTFFFLVQG